MYLFETEMTNEPNLDPQLRGGFSSAGSTSTGWDSLSSVPFGGVQRNTTVMDMEKVRRKRDLLVKINHAILQVVYEQKKIDSVILAIYQAIGGSPSGFEKTMINDCKNAKANIDKTLSYLYNCRNLANNLTTESSRT